MSTKLPKRPVIPAQYLEPVPLSTPPVKIVLGIRRYLGAILHGPSETLDRFSRAGQAYLFDGIDDFIEVPNNPYLLSQEFTVVVTFKLLALPPLLRTQTGDQLVNKITLVAQHYNIQITHFGGASYCHISYDHKISTGKYTLTCDIARIDLNRYYQVAVTYASGNLRLFVDGMLMIEEFKVPKPVFGNEPLLVGKQPDPNYPNFFKGIIDGLSVCDWPLSNDELTRLYQAGLP